MNGLNGNSPPDYLILGHITKDRIVGGYRLGGTAVYSGILARRMGLKVAIYTSGASDLNLDILDGIEIINQPGAGTTTFINDYTATGRVQRLLDRADDLDPDQIPASWNKARIIHLAPVAREVPFSAGEQFPDGYLGFSLQGWMRNWDDNGHITPASLPDLSQPLGERAIGFVSLEDLGNDRSRMNELQGLFSRLALTLGAEGMEYFQADKRVYMPAPTTAEVDPTGAGDIFAGAFLVYHHLHGKSIEESARLANILAAASVKRPGTAGIPQADEINELIKVQR